MNPKVIVRFALSIGLGALALNPSPAEANCSPSQYTSGVCWTSANYCPRNFAMADGRILSIKQFPSLFSLIGTTFGGDGQTTFALPDLRNRAPAGIGQGPGLSNIRLGQAYGAESNKLTPDNLPAHSHTVSLQMSYSATVSADIKLGNLANAADATLAARPTLGPPPKRKAIFVKDTNPSSVMAENAAQVSLETDTIETMPAGEPANSQAPVSLRPPQLTVTACISVRGIYPPRN